MIGYTVTPKVTYGQGTIVKDGNKLSRDLWMDVYEPVGKAKNPPSLLFIGQHDLEQAHEAMALMLQKYKEVGAEYTFSWVPGFGHFYPAGAASLSGDGSKMSVEARILKFLDQKIGED